MTDKGNKGCNYEGTPVPHGDKVCSKETNTLHECINGTLKDTGVPCPPSGTGDDGEKGNG
tara:strand:+ start:2263 stop:2442 length:180 start_codon:yes stop_codon:yes gene_type:complete